MKKHNEGYTLVLVLVVILVLAACATAVLSFSVQNLKTQQRMVERMQAKYAAQGEVERIIGQLEQEITISLAENTEADVNKVLNDWIKSNCGDQTKEYTADFDGNFKCKNILVEITNPETTEFNYTITCEISISGEIQPVNPPLSEEIIGYKISGVIIEYTSYEIGGAAS